MRVKVKLVVFRHPEPAGWRTFCGYCPELQAFFASNVESEIISYIQGRLIRDLKDRLKYQNLIRCGWEVSENSVKVPIFTNEEAIKLASKSFDVTVVEPKIIEINADLPNTDNNS